MDYFGSIIQWWITSLQWIVRCFRAERGSCRAGCSASQRMMAPSSALDTGNISREMEVHVLAFFPGLVFSWVCPDLISWSSAYQRSVGGGLPPVAIHSISRSSPAEAMMLSALSPTRWITILSGFSGNQKTLTFYGRQIHGMVCDEESLGGMLFIFRGYVDLPWLISSLAGPMASRQSSQAHSVISYILHLKALFE